ncbi:MAG: acyl-ACP desaturase [Gammaproteobacteria bacterium]|nr:acyl-ACP desaturase [Gammaproteobacteria bacterium]
MVSALSHTQSSRPQQDAVLADLEAVVQRQIDAHLQRRRLWFPSDLSAVEAEPAQLAELRVAAGGIPDAVRVGLAINLLTEEGLPHFHRLIATHLGTDNPWNTWNNLWTAEEDRHGCALRDYVRDTGLFDMGALERMQYRYIESGFNPDWGRDPYRLLAYTSLQERATQMAHANTGRACAAHETRIQQVLAHISSDESRHHAFYRSVFAGIIERDPNRALYALLKVMPALAMPGHTIPDYDHMAEVVRRAGLYGPRHYQKIVEELLEFWGIGRLSGLSAEGRACQEKLMRVPARLTRMSDYQDAKAGPREFRFDFLHQRALVF